MPVSEEIMLKVENVSKIYKLGEIGGATLRDELQRLGAKIRHKPDPTKKVGAKNYNKGEKFKALDNVSFVVKKGERIGIIGHNGAGKSTLLKLISRVTGPTSGNIYMNGRVASMLEVGTGFHPELTGRENVYMNGAILGMTKKEIDAKIEDIIEFSEVRQFIDTPVKRYSSGMYVKLAFSVAAHLDSEIMIMDEVLAVGDMAFQNKCLNKMKEISEQENRTILYVSHNMSTIRQLCDRTIVFDTGKVVFDGSVEDGIGVYLGNGNSKLEYFYSEKDHSVFKKGLISICSMSFACKTAPIYSIGETIKGRIGVNSKINKKVKIRFELSNQMNNRIGTSISNSIIVSQKEDNTIIFSFATDYLVPGRYYVDIVLFEYSDSGGEIGIDGVYPGFAFDIVSTGNDIFWQPQNWGYVRFPDFNVDHENS